MTKEDKKFISGLISGLESRMDKKFHDGFIGLESRMDGKLTSLESRMVGKIEGLESRMVGKIEGLESRLNKKIQYNGVMLERLRDKVDAIGDNVITLNRQMSVNSGLKCNFSC